MEMNREEIIKATATKALMDEINYLVETSEYEEWEEIHTVESAFTYVSELSDEGGWERLRTPVNKVHIALGDLVERPLEFFDDVVTNRGTRWDLKLEGKYYTWGATWGW